MQDVDLLTQLNPPQQEAVNHTEGPLLILAGAGSGKTRVLTHRIAYIIEQQLATPEQILAVTFTNKAASEMKKRIQLLIGIPVQGLWIGTFHSVSARILHREAKYAGFQSNFSIYDANDQENLIKRIMGFLDISRETLTPKQALYAISNAKSKLQDAGTFEKKTTGIRSELIAKIFREYQVSLRRNNAFDFDDLINKPIEIFTAHPEVLQKYQDMFRYILIDEYQDTNRAQYYWAKLLGAAHQNLCVVGDEDQSIYHWRGADISNILNFEKDYQKCKLIRLEQNYRSTQNILNAANIVISKNMKRLGKELWSKKGAGELIQLIQTQDEQNEAASTVEIIQNETLQNGFSLSEIVILYRTNAQSRALEDQLRRSGIPYSIVGGLKFYERKEIKDILAYLKILVNPKDSVSLLRIINFPSRGIGASSLNTVTQFASENDLLLYQVLAEAKSISGLSSGIADRIASFYQSIEFFRKKLSRWNAFQIAEAVIDKFKLREIYEESQLVEDETRLENVNEFLNSVEIYVASRPNTDSLPAYLDEVSLLTDIDRWDPEKPTVTLMTLHSAKGLEFPVVIICGMEDGLFPISRNSDSEEDLEEERRLFYVGMTRAEEKLYLLNALTRRRFGREEFGMNFRSFPSRFLQEIPEEYIQVKNLQDYTAQDFQVARQKHRKSRENTRLENLGDEESDFKIGQYVRHEIFGKGQVLGVDLSTMGTKLTIQFENKSIKKLIAEYANLTSDEDSGSHDV